ncbi:MAG: nucleotide exchange factor GrpE [Holosporaceae bacterium]|jgi:molecular chaperone GrpE|nr:nucleotide exchange factor GrpE [Holosporaceae bacterium]
MSEENNQSDGNSEKNLESVNENASLEDQVQKLKDEIGMLKDTVLRKMAESENLRKRLEKEKEEVIRYSNAKFAKDLLAVVDNFERVSENSASIKEKIETDDGLKAFFAGIELCEKELISTFKRHGIYRTEVKEGDEFNPEYHQAMCELDSPDHKAGVIIKVFQTGYIYNDRLLRPAMVSVSKKT